MGVHGLWELLAPVGRRVSVETLAGKRLAVDASIWMVQFMRAMRDDQGDMIRDAHLLGFLRRICKLLFLRARPVFVFDGATPALKRRTLAARRRHRDAAQAKVRKTAEKLLLSHLKARKLEELAAQIKSDRAKHDSKGKQVENSKREEVEKANIDQSKSDDGENSGGTVTPINQEKLDEMLAASLAAEEEADLIDKGKNHSASVPSQGAGITEDDDEDDDEMIFPMTMGDIDPAVLASLPPSMQLDLLVQMRERVMAENRQKYQKIKKEPAKFSELQIQSYLKTVAFRREIDEVQRCAAGKGVGGVQTSKIASEANREFIFSSSFTGDKQALAQRVGKEHIVDSVKSKKEINTAVFKSNPASSSRTKPNNGEPLGSFGPDVETYRDERGRIRVSRVRAMGIRMTRDIQRNLDFIKEHEQVKNKIHNTVVEGSTNNEEPPDFPEHLFESNELGSSLHLGEDFDETASDNHQTTSVIGGPDKISDGTYHGSKETIEISFVDDQTEVKDSDDQIFLHLVSGISSNLFTIDDRLPKSTDESDGPDCISKEGILQGETFPMEVDEKDHQDSLMDNRCTDDEIDWEEGGCDLPGGPSSNENNQSKVLKGDLEEDALIQEAIRRSLEDFENQEPENVTPEDLQSSLEDKFLQSYDDVPKPSGAAGKKYSHSEPALVTKTDDEIGKEINPDENDVANELLEADGHESENQTQPEDNKGQADMNRAYLLDTPPPCNTTTSTSASKSYSSEVQNDNDKVSVQNSLNSDNSKCITDDSYIGETSKSIQKGFLLDELVANTAIRNQNIAQKAMDDSISEINYTQLNDNVGIHNNLEKELSLLRQEQVYLGNERRKLESHAESVSSEMFAECQELLQMFGLPYIIAPMEAEAQCAYMEMNNLVDGVVTDDSDVFLFGARNVYKNIFDDRKYVETYLMKDIESELGLTREQLIRMALLLGSDYTEGISGIGIVNAIEVAHAFPEEDGLQKFREWVESPDPTLLGKLGMESVSSSKRNSDGKGSSQEPECIEGSDESLSSSEKQHIKEIFMSKHRNVSKNWHIPSTFPSESVINAYMSPQIDDSTEPFSWGRPDSSLLRKLCWERFGWSKEKADELFVPVLREYNKHETQLRMEAFYSFNERFAKIRSKRIKKSIKGITGKSFPETDELDQDRPNTSNASKKKERSTSGRGRAKGRRTKDATPENIGSQGHEIGDADSFADADGLTKENSAGSKKKNTNPCGPSRGKGRRRMNGAREIMGSQEYSELSNLASDEDSHKIHTNDYELEGFPLRRSNRKRKQVTYVEDGQQADDNDVSTHQINENQGQGSLEEDMGHMAGYDTQSNLFHQDTSQLNSDQMHTDPSDMNEDPSGFELQVDCQVDSAPKDYLFTGGGFCTEKGDDQDTAIDQSGAAREHGTSEDIDGVSDNNKNVSYCTGECTRNADTKAHGVSISQRHDATRASSAKPTVTKRGGKS